MRGLSAETLIERHNKSLFHMDFKPIRDKRDFDVRRFLIALKNEWERTKEPREAFERKRVKSRVNVLR